MLLIIGGRTEGALRRLKIHNSVYQLNLQSRLISQLPYLAIGRFGAACCELNGRVYVAAGYDGRDNCTKTIEYLDIVREDKSWTTFALKNLKPRANPTMSALNKTPILIAGG